MLDFQTKVDQCGPDVLVTQPLGCCVHHLDLTMMICM